MSLAKNIALVIISPKYGWEEVNLSGYTTQKVLQRGFYPMLALLAAASFVRMVYDPTTWTLSKTLIHAIIEFSSYFATYFITSYLLGGFYPELVKTHSANMRLNNFIAYNLIFLVILEILNNLLADGFSPIQFLLLFTLVITYYGTEYLGIKDSKKIPKFVVISSAMMTLLPMLFRMILEALTIK